MQTVQGIGSGFHAVQDKQITLAYDEMDQLKFVNRYENLDGTGTSLRSVYAYDPANRLTALTHRNVPTSGSLTDLAKYNFQYDTMNRITSTIRPNSSYERVRPQFAPKTAQNGVRSLTGADHASTG